MWTESSKGPTIHVWVVFGKFKSSYPTFHAMVQLLNPADFNLQILDPNEITAVCLTSTCWLGHYQ